MTATCHHPGRQPFRLAFRPVLACVICVTDRRQAGRNCIVRCAPLHSQIEPSQIKLHDRNTADWKNVIDPCHLGWRTLLRWNKTNHACLSSTVTVWDSGPAVQQLDTSFPQTHIVLMLFPLFYYNFHIHSTCTAQCLLSRNNRKS